ncbi:MAG: toll/interleukin-1 receptor domain-containing protein [Candidatus Pacebacteria bacterium]|nr:toll/interleukin-1 receptor domain-containing protein [Candidatus Paceibacterota bacterium]
MKKAKVFISCSQRSGEKEIGLKVATYLRKKGFDPYFAEEVQTPEALTSNIFEALKGSEYFISINFPRDFTKTGSLFIQQEFAIAAFFGIPMLAFRKGQIKIEGVGKYLILKSISINSYEDVVRHLRKELKKWNPKSLHQLELTCDHHHSNIATRNIANAPLSNWLHVVVRNLSDQFYCKNCYAYVDSIIDLSTSATVITPTDYRAELVWAGLGEVTLNIPQGVKRDFDMLVWYHGSNVVQFHQKTTSTEYGYPALQYGRYKIVYGVISDNFPLAKIEVEIDFTATGVNILNSNQIE